MGKAKRAKDNPEKSSNRGEIFGRAERLLQAEDYVGVMECLTALSGATDERVRAVESAVLHPAVWSCERLSQLSTEQLCRFFVAVRARDPEGAVTGIFRCRAFAELWNSDADDDWHTLGKLLGAGRERANRVQFINQARVRMRLLRARPVRDLSGVVPFVLSGLATDFASCGATAEIFASNLAFAAEVLVEDAGSSGEVDADKMAAWRELALRDARTLGDLYAWLLSAQPDALTRDGGVLLAPSYARTLDSTSWIYRAFVSLLAAAPENIRHSYSPKGIEQTLFEVGLGDPAKQRQRLEQWVKYAINSDEVGDVGEWCRLAMLAHRMSFPEAVAVLDRLPLASLPVSARWILCAAHLERAREKRHLHGWVYSPPVRDVRRAIELCPDSTFAERLGQLLVRADAIAEVTRLLDDEKQLIARFKNAFSPKATREQRLAFYELLMCCLTLPFNVQPIPSKSEVCLSIRPVCEILRSVMRNRTYRSRFAEFMPEIDCHIKHLFKCWCDDCVMTFCSIVADKASVVFYDGDYSIALLWPQPDEALMAATSVSQQNGDAVSVHLRFPFGADNAFVRLGLSRSASKKEILAKVIEIMRVRSGEMAGLRGAQASLFDAKHRALHEFCAGIYFES